MSAGPFSNPLFRAIWFALVVSFIGSFVQDVAERWVILDLTHSPSPSAMLSTIFVSASLVGTLPAGVLADRYERRTLVMISQVVQGLTAAAIGTLVLTHHVTPGILMLGAASLGLGMSIGTPAWNALMPDLVPRAQVADAIALNAVAFNIARAVGPAIGGVVLSAAGAGTSFLINAVSFLIVVGVLAGVRLPAKKDEAPPPIWSAFREPLRHARVDPGIRGTMIGMLAYSFGAAMVYALAPAFGRQTLSANPTQYGLLFGAMGAGSVAGTWVLRRIRPRMTPRMLIAMTTLVYASAALAMSQTRHVYVAIILFLPAGAGWTGTFSSLSTLVQLWTPDRFRARMSALYVVGHFGMWAAGSSLGGVIADHRGVRAAMVLGASLCGLTALLISRLPLPASFTGLSGSIPPELDPVSS